MFYPCSLIQLHVCFHVILKTVLVFPSTLFHQQGLIELSFFLCELTVSGFVLSSCFELSLFLCLSQKVIIKPVRKYHEYQ